MSTNKMSALMLKNLSANDWQNDDAAIAIIDELIAKCDFESVEHILEELIPNADNKCLYIERAGLIFEKKNKHQSAIDQYKECLSLDKSYYPAHIGILRVRLNTHQYISAYKEIDEAKKYYPNDIDVLTISAKILYLSGRIADALNHYMLLIEHYPNSFNGYTGAGDASFALDRMADALHYYTTAYEKFPNEYFPKLHLADFESYAGNTDSEISILFNMFNFNPDITCAKRLYGLLIQKGRHDEARDFLEKAVEKFPNSAFLARQKKISSFESTFENTSEIIHIPYKEIISLLNGSPTYLPDNTLQSNKINIPVPDASDFKKKLPVNLEDLDTHFRNLFNYTLIRDLEPAFYVIENCFMIPPGIIITGHGILKQSVYANIDHAKGVIEDSLKHPNISIIDKPVYLFQTLGISCYYHYVVEMLPALDIFNHIRNKNSEKIYLGVIKDNSNYVTESLQLFLDDDADKLFLSERNAYFIKKLYLPKFLGCHGWSNFSANFWKNFKASLNNTENNNPTKLYSRRGKDIIGESILEEYLADNGFQIVDNSKLSFEEQITTFKNANTVFGINGANLVNTMFMPEGSKVIEIAPDGRPECWVYGGITSIFNLQHYVWFFDSKKTSLDRTIVFDSNKIKELDLLLKKYNLI